MPPESDPDQTAAAPGPAAAAPGPAAAAPGPAADPSTAGAAGSRLPAVERRLTELTRDHRQVVRELSKAVDGLRATGELARESAAALSEALPRLDAAADGLVELQGRVEELSAQLAATPRVTAVCWPALTAEQADEVWGELASWIADVLGPFYRVTRGELPDCWARHPDAVLELVWLHTSYREVFEGGVGRPTAAAEWHTRWRPGALEAIAAAIPTRLCRPGEHLISERAADAARSDARDARDARARARAAALGDPYGARRPDGYRPPPRPTVDVDVDVDGGADTGRPTYDPLREQVTEREHWSDHFAKGRADDLAWRRQRGQ